MTNVRAPALYPIRKFLQIYEYEIPFLRDIKPST